MRARRKSSAWDLVAWKRRFITNLNFLPVVGKEWKMCEFSVVLNGKTVFKEAVYAKTESNSVKVKNVLGEAKEFKNCRIVEVDVNSTRLVLSSV
jgi:predicted RNA-binding protein